MPTTLPPAPELRRRRPQAGELPRRSPRLLGMFRRYVRWYVPRHFTALRLARSGFHPDQVRGPMVVVLNHPSWWDPLLCLLLCDLFPKHDHYAPIDARMLQKYRFFEKLGFFGIEPASVRGGRTFLETGSAILREPHGALWVTGEGRFTDVRRRPVKLQGGLGHLLAQQPQTTVLPLALELVFWNERLPEALARFGEPLAAEPNRSPAEWTSELQIALEHNLDALALDSQSRSPERFEILLEGRKGVGLAYDAWRRIHAFFTGKKFTAGHE